MSVCSGSSTAYSIQRCNSRTTPARSSTRWHCPQLRWKRWTRKRCIFTNRLAAKDAPCSTIQARGLLTRRGWARRLPNGFQHFGTRLWTISAEVGSSGRQCMRARTYTCKEAPRDGSVARPRVALGGPRGRNTAMDWRSQGPAKIPLICYARHTPHHRHDRARAAIRTSSLYGSDFIRALSVLSVPDGNSRWRQRVRLTCPGSDGG